MHALRRIAPRGLACIVAAAAFLAAARSTTARASEPSRLVAWGVTVEHSPADTARARAVPGVIEDVRREVSSSLGLSAPEAITVRMLRDPRAFAGTSWGRPVELFAGMAYPHSATILLNADALDAAGTATALARTVRHEFVHLALGHSLGGADLPKWFEEGLACAFGSPLPAEAAAQLDPRGAPHLSSLRLFPREADDLARAYAQAESVVRLLIARHSTESVRRIVTLVRAGDSFEHALRAATGGDADSLDRAWRGTYRTSWAHRILGALFAPDRILLWTALFVVAGFFFVRARRRRAVEDLDRFF